MRTQLSWHSYTEKLAAVLGRVEFTDAAGRVLSADEAFETWHQLTVSVREQQKTVYLIGNGASASMASHFSADLAKNGHLHTQVFSDLSLLTAIGNDLGYSEVFAVPLERRAQPGDLLVAISSSGRSPNILNAARVAGAKKMKLITLTGFDADNPLRQLGDLNAHVPTGTYGLTETCHAAILHHWMDSVEILA